MKYPGGTILKYYDYSGKIDGIVLYRLSHLGNSLDDSIKVIEFFFKNDKDIISVTEKVNLKILCKDELKKLLGISSNEKAG